MVQKCSLMFPSSPVYISSIVQCVQYVQCVYSDSGSVVRALNFPWETTLGAGRVLAGLGLDTGLYSPPPHHTTAQCQHCLICHTFKWYLSTISSHFTQYHFIVFIAHAHTERQTSFNSATSHILHMLHNGGPSVQLRCDGVCSEEVACYHCYQHHHLSVCCSPGVRQQTMKQQSGVHRITTITIITPRRGTLHSPQQAASSRVSRVGVTIPWSPTPRGWAAGAGS